MHRTDRINPMHAMHELPNTKESDIMPNMLSAKEVAIKLDTTPRTLRKFLRSDEKTTSPGKGGRYTLPASQVKSLQSRFNAWSAQRAQNTTNGDIPLEGDEGDADTE